MEGNHHVLKSYIQLGKLDLLGVHKRITSLLANQKIEITQSLEYDKLMISRHHHIHCFQDLISKISQFALDKLFEQYELIQKKSTDACSNLFTGIYGLPCSHKIRQYIQSGSSIPLEAIHEQWRLELGTPNRPPLEQFSPGKSLMREVEHCLNDDPVVRGNVMPRLWQVLDTRFETITQPDASREEKRTASRCEK